MNGLRFLVGNFFNGCIDRCSRRFVSVDSRLVAKQRQRQKFEEVRKVQNYQAEDGSTFNNLDDLIVYEIETTIGYFVKKFIEKEEIELNDEDFNKITKLTELSQLR